jgi:hypothetical protein
MERVAFLIEATGERISCLLNPESLTFRRSAGLKRRSDRGGMLSGAASTDDPLIATGGGITELTLNLLFDTEVAESLKPRPDTAAGAPLTGSTDALAIRTPLPPRSLDVRELTRPFWNLSENATPTRSAGGLPVVRFIWGRAWNIPGVVMAVAEKLERFGHDGAPQRSWMTLRLRRVADSAVTNDQPSGAVTPQHEFPAALDSTLLGQSPRVEVLADADGRPATRLDLIANNHLGDPFDWPLIAHASGIEDPLKIEGGTILTIPTDTAPAVQA